MVASKTLTLMMKLLTKKIVFGHTNNFKDSKSDLTLNFLNSEDITVEGSNLIFHANKYELHVDDQSLHLDKRIECCLSKNYGFSDENQINETLNDVSSKFSMNFYKNIYKIIEKDTTGFFNQLENDCAKIDEVYIFGHSINDLDKPYYKKIIEILKYGGRFDSIKWNVSHYINSEKYDNKKDLEAELRTLKIMNYRFIKVKRLPKIVILLNSLIKSIINKIFK